MIKNVLNQVMLFAAALSIDQGNICEKFLVGVPMILIEV